MEKLIEFYISTNALSTGIKGSVGNINYNYPKLSIDSVNIVRNRHLEYCVMHSGILLIMQT